MSNAQFIGIGGPHDLGLAAVPAEELKIDQVDKTLSYWERSIHALLALLSTKKPPLLTTDELRRAVEGMERGAYHSWGYYERWSVAMATILLERNVITQTELDFEINGESKVVLDAEGNVPIVFKEGDLVQVRAEDTRLRWRKPHLRCPGYIFGLKGRINKYIGHFDDPYLLAFRGSGPKQPLYSVSFSMTSVSENSTTIPYSDLGDIVEADIYQEWLTLLAAECSGGDHDHHHGHESAAASGESCCGHHEHKDCSAGSEAEHDHHHHHDHHTSGVKAEEEAHHGHHHHSHHSHDHHDHGASAAAPDHDHGHTHEGRYETECTALEREGKGDEAGKIVGEALLRALYTKGVITRDDVRKKIEWLDSVGVQMLGKDLVVKCWRDPAFQLRLVYDGPSACRELGIETSNPNAPTVLRVYANTDAVHHIVVCTLCSCYPFKLLGYSPSWYKSRSYRARVVKEPRKVLNEFGTTLPETTRIRVLDSTADCRYMVIPQPPRHLREHPEALAALTDEELRALVTRDSMVGVTVL